MLRLCGDLADLRTTLCNCQTVCEPLLWGGLYWEGDCFLVLTNFCGEFAEQCGANIYLNCDKLLLATPSGECAVTRCVHLRILSYGRIRSGLWGENNRNQWLVSSGISSSVVLSLRVLSGEEGIERLTCGRRTWCRLCGGFCARWAICSGTPSLSRGIA